MDSGLNILFEQKLIHDNPCPEMKYTEGNDDVEFNTLSEQLVMSDAHTVQNQEVEVDVHDVKDVKKVNGTGRENHIHRQMRQ